MLTTKIKIFINNKPIIIDKSYTILQVCENLGINIPRFCYNESLSIAGNCRMCLVEIKNSPKLMASCAVNITNNMEIFTDSLIVKKARESVLEFLLINHPLDCPICDQGGECDLQDQAIIYGSDRSRFHEYKRSVQDKNVGPLIKTIMTRCIHCTRCIRFATEIAGVENLGTLGRGYNMEVGSYISKIFNSELSANIIDLCPVGALTSKPFAFMARPWELKKIESIDILDGLGSNIVINIKSNKIIRILPKTNKVINKEWISNKTRFSYNGLIHQRLLNPMLKKNGKFTIITWNKAFQIINDKLNKILMYSKNPSLDIVGIFGEFIDLETSIAFKNFLKNLNSSSYYLLSLNNKLNYYKNNLNLLNNHNFNFDNLNNLNTCLLIGLNPRFESSVFNIFLRKNVINNNLKIYTINSSINLTYPLTNLSNNLNIFNNLLSNNKLLKIFNKKENLKIILGLNLLINPNGELIFLKLKKLQKKFNFSLNIIFPYCNLEGFLKLNIKPKNLMLNKKNIKLLYLVGTNSKKRKINKKNTFIIYQGHTGCYDAQIANLILPTTTFFEKNTHYMNTQGIIQKTQKAIQSTNKILDDWLIFQKLSNYLINNNNIYYKLIVNVNPFMKLIKLKNLNNNKKNHNFNNKINLNKEIYKNNLLFPLIDNFYNSDLITNNSTLLVKCSKIYTQDNFLNS